MTSQGGRPHPLKIRGDIYTLSRGSWSTSQRGVDRLEASGRVVIQGKTPRYVRFADDFPVNILTNVWNEQLSEQYKSYVVQTSTIPIQRCVLMTTDPGSGTTAYVAEQWGRRWITIDTSRVALALARARIMGARYSYYLLSDSDEGREKEAGISRTVPPSSPTFSDIRQGFVYERVPHITRHRE